MPTYMAYQLAQDGRTLASPIVIQANHDAEAIAQAIQLADGYAMEVWDEERRIGVIERHDHSQ